MTIELAAGRLAQHRARSVESPPGAPAREMRGLCHDLRLELAAIRMSLTALRRGTDTSHEVRDRVRAIEDHCSVVEDLLTRALHVEPATEAVDVRDVLAETVHVVQAFVPGTITLTTDGDAVVLAEWASLRRLFMNLIDNAARAAGDDGQVRVDVRRAEHEVVVEVCDSGPGYGRSSRGVAGLGMSVVQDVLTRYHGRLDIDLGDLGGARVRVSMPAAAAS
jgi:signal transduction histidine kinase